MMSNSFEGEYGDHLHTEAKLIKLIKEPVLPISRNLLLEFDNLREPNYSSSRRENSPESRRTFEKSKNF